VPRVIFFGLGGPKLLQMQNLRDRFVVFFLGGKNHNFVKVKGLKLQLSQRLIKIYPNFFIKRKNVKILC